LVILLAELAGQTDVQLSGAAIEYQKYVGLVSSEKRLSEKSKAADIESDLNAGSRGGRASSIGGG
jgi:hypothetical protein